MAQILTLLAIILTSQLAHGIIFNPHLMMSPAFRALQNQNSSEELPNPCANRFFDIINNDKNAAIFNTMFVSTGKSPNDLGNYERCISDKNLAYALVTITGDTFRQRV